MCTFMSTSDLPSDTKSGKNKPKQFITLYMKPNKDNEMLRVRLLWYKQASKNDRSTPYIWQMIHDHWGTTESGKKIVDDICICPSTKYSKYDEEKFIKRPGKDKKELNCPICRKANEAYTIWKNSGYKDKVSATKFNSLKAKFRACIPVYVVNDPNAWNEDKSQNYNNGKMKVLIFTNKKEFDAFDKLVNEERARAYIASQNGSGYELFNGGNAVDLFLQMKTVPEIRNEGKDNQYTAQVRKITGMKFGTKPYPIPEINKDNIDSFEFDEQFYISNTKEELQMFYKKYYGQNDVNVPTEDITFDDDTTASDSTPNFHTADEDKGVVPSKPVSVSNPIKKEENVTEPTEFNIDDIDVTPDEPTTPSEPIVSDDTTIQDESVDALLEDLGID